MRLGRRDQQIAMILCKSAPKPGVSGKGREAAIPQS
jgi:hypothetical protein